MRAAVPDWYNLSRHCDKASLIVKPKRGTAIMWYNHFLEDKVKSVLTAYHMGRVTRRSTFKHAHNAHSDHPEHAQIMIRAFALH